MSTVGFAQIFKNAGVTLACRVLSIVLSLVTVPAIISRVGMKGYGSWEAVLSVSTLTAQLVIVLQITMLWRVSHLVGKGDAEKAKTVVGMGVLTAICLGSVAFLGCLALAGPILALLRIPAEFQPTLLWALPVSAGLFGLNGASECQAALVSARQKSGQISVAVLLSSIANYVITLIALAFGLKLWAPVLGQLGGAILYFLLVAFLAQKFGGGMSLLPRLGSREEWIELRTYAARLTAARAAIMMKGQLDRVILSAVASPIWSGWYGIAMRLANLVSELGVFFSVPLLTASANLKSQDKTAEIYPILDRVVLTVTIAVGVVIAGLGASHRFLQTAWLGSYEPQISILLTLLLVAAAAQVLTDPFMAALKGLGQIAIETKTTGIGAVANLLLTVVLVPLLGATGTVWATSIAAVGTAIYFAQQVKTQNLLPLAVMRRSLAMVGIAFAFFGTLGALTHGYPLPIGWSAIGSMLLAGTLAGTVYLGILQAARLAPGPKQLLHLVKRR